MLAVFIVTTTAAAVAQQTAPITVTTILDPAFWAKQTATVANTLKTADQTAQELVYAEKTYKQTLQAMQSLGKGDWQGVLSAMDYETAAVNNYANAVTNLPSLSQITAVRQLAQTEGYQKAALAASNLAASFNAADQTFHSTDYLIQDTKARERAAAEILANAAAQKPGSIQLAQDRIEQLQLLQGEISDTNMVLGSFQNYLAVQQQNQLLQQQLVDAWVNHVSGAQNNFQSTYVSQEPSVAAENKSFDQQLAAAGW